MAREPKTIINLTELSNSNNSSNPNQGAAQLELSTRKYDNGQLVSSANVMWIHNGMMSCILFGDFSKTYVRTRERGTQKNLDQQHATAFADVEAIKRDVLDFYAAKAGKQRQEVA